MTTIWAHRGASSEAPENTLAAFDLARRQGADGVELDVQLTADGRLICIHDETLDRTTSGSGPVGARTLDELKQLDASYGKAAYAGEKLPTLDEVFDLLGPTNMTINVELKNSIVPYVGLEAAVLDLISRSGMADRVILSTFNHYSLVELARTGSTIARGMLYQDVLYQPWEYATSLRVDAVHPPKEMVTHIPSYVESCHAAGLKVNAWTLDSEADIRAGLDAGIDAVITDFPARALARR